VQEDHCRRQRAQRDEQRDPLGGAGQRDSDRSRITDQVVTHHGPPAPGDRVQFITGPSPSLGQDIGRAQRRGHAASLDGGARGSQDEGVVSIREGAWVTSDERGDDGNGCANGLTDGRSAPCGATTYSTCLVQVEPAPDRYRG
jgi:hypothetical protein